MGARHRFIETLVEMANEGEPKRCGCGSVAGAHYCPNVNPPLTPCGVDGCRCGDYQDAPVVDSAALPTQLAQPTGRRAELIYELLSFANRAPVEQVEALTARTRNPSPIACIYIAGAYTAPDAWGVEQNVRRAESLAYEVAKLGAMPVCPHTNLRYMCYEIAEFMYPATLELMRRCDAVFLLPNWQSSTGARDEREDALRVGIPRFSTIRSLAEWLSARGKRDGGA